MTSSAVLISTPQISNAKPTAKQDEYKNDQSEKLARAKEKERVRERDAADKAYKVEPDTRDFEDELETATTLATPIVANVMVTPAPDLMASQINVSLLPAVATDDVITPIETTPNVLANTTTTSTTASVTDTSEQSTSETPDIVANTTTTTTEVTPPPVEDAPILSSAEMKKFIDQLNRTATLTDEGLRIIPSEANKTAIQSALNSDPNLLNKPDAIATLMANLQTKPANGLAKGIDIRLEKTTELNLYAIADATESPVSDTDLADAVETISTAPNTTDGAAAANDDTQAPSFDDVMIASLTTTSHNSTGHSASGLGLTVASVITPNTASTPSYAGANAHTTLPQSATQAVAAVIDKFVKDEKTGAQSISLRLDPAELGRMDVRMEYKKGDPLKVHLVVEKADTMNMFLRDQNALEQALNQAGLKSESVSLSFEHNQNAFDHAMQDHSSHNGSHAHGRDDGQASSRSDMMAEIDELVHTHLDMYIDAHGLTRYNVTV